MESIEKATESHSYDTIKVQVSSWESYLVSAAKMEKINKENSWKNEEGTEQYSHKSERNPWIYLQRWRYKQEDEGEAEHLLGNL